MKKLHEGVMTQRPSLCRCLIMALGCVNTTDGERDKPILEGESYRDAEVRCAQSMSQGVREAL